MKILIKEENYNSGFISMTTIKEDTEEKAFEEVYKYFKSYQYCNNCSRSIVDKNIADKYHEWIKNNSEKMWWKTATGRDYD